MCGSWRSERTLSLDFKVPNVVPGDQGGPRAAAHREYGSGDAALVDLTTRGHRRGRPMALTAHRASQPAQMELSRPLWATIDLRLRYWALPRADRRRVI